jgi:hypothetical protein
MKTLIIAVPKSGTHLLREILETAGLGHSHIHIGREGLFDYGKLTYEMGREYPMGCLERMPLEAALARVDTYAMSHLRYSEEAHEKLAGFRLLLVSRDISEIILSGMVWSMRTGRRPGKWKKAPNDRKRLKQWIEKYGEWIVKEYKSIMEWEPYAHHFSYEELRNGSERLAKLYGIEDIHAVTEKAIASETLTKLAPYKPSTYWDQESKSMVNKLVSS